MPPGEADTSQVPGLGSILDGKYRLVRDIAAGAMGRLIEAEHLLLERPVAIKFVSSTPDAKSRRRMMQEARAAQQLSSEHVVRVFDVGLAGECPYIVMELLQGADLGTIVERHGPLPIVDAVDYVVQACVGLAEAHAASVIHRDIKPSNLFVSESSGGTAVVKLVDFGISKTAEPTLGAAPTGERTADTALLGSPYYMSPEQLRNPTRVDARTDVWSLAVTLFHLLSATHPFEGETLNEISAEIFTERPRDLRALRPDLPAALCEVIERALAKRPEERTSSVVELGRELAPFGSALARLSAERLSMRAQPVPLVSYSRSSSPSIPSASDTELGTTLPAVSADTASHSAEDRNGRAPNRRPGRLLLVLALGAVGGAAALALTNRSSTPAPSPPSGADAPFKAAPSPPSEPLAIAPSSAEPVVPTPPPPSASVPTPVPTPAAKVMPARPSGPASRAVQPSASAKPRTALDIDGVPIVE